MNLSMNARHRPSLLSIALVAVGIVWGIEVAVLLWVKSRAQAESGRFERVNREINATLAEESGSSPQSAVPMTERQRRAMELLDDLETRLGCDDAAEWWSTRKKPQPSDAFFDVAGFVERMRELASRRRIKIKAGECFGFAAYVRDASDETRLGAVVRDRLVLDRILGVLMNAGPDELLSVQRGAPRKKASSLPADAKDTFEIDPRLSVRTTSAVEAASYRISFTGRTDVLRSLLNGLAELEFPLLVRSVEAARIDAAAVHAPSLVSGEVRTLASQTTRFCVVIEAVELAPREGKAG
ncbi:MAG: hypothetical protein JWM88_1646 [Verrucomicrobia bacterium]|nr:hypothetical protein [Verrucomicrobiota bacterium]